MGDLEPDHAPRLRAMVAQLRRVGAMPEPERIGRYRLLRRIDGGAMGVVWLAEDEHLHRLALTETR